MQGDHELGAQELQEFWYRDRLVLYSYQNLAIAKNGFVSSFWILSYC